MLKKLLSSFSKKPAATGHTEIAAITHTENHAMVAQEQTGASREIQGPSGPVPVIMAYGPYWGMTILVIVVLVGAVNEVQYRRGKKLLGAKIEMKETEFYGKLDEKVSAIVTQERASTDALSAELSQLKTTVSTIKFDLAKLQTQLASMESDIKLASAPRSKGKAKRSIASVRASLKNLKVKR